MVYDNLIFGYKMSNIINLWFWVVKFSGEFDLVYLCDLVIYLYILVF